MCQLFQIWYQHQKKQMTKKMKKISFNLLLKFLVNSLRTFRILVQSALALHQGDEWVAYDHDTGKRKWFSALSSGAPLMSTPQDT